MSCDVRIWIVISAGDSILLADPVDLLNQRYDRVEFFVSLANRHLELLVTVNQTLEEHEQDDN